MTLVIIEQPVGHIIAEETGLGFEHTDGGVVLQISQQGRSGEPKRAAYAEPARWLEAYCGVAPTGLIGSVVANGWQDWSFGLGRTQLLGGRPVTAPVRIGVVGYGVGGKYFHTPFIEAAEGVELAGVVTRSASRRAHLAKDWPGVPVFDSLAALLASGVDAVTITTPPQTRSALVLEAVAAGVHVIADKPFAPTAVEARRLVRAADDAGVILNVFHNRRWDADIRTLAAVVADGRLGDVWRVHTRMDQDAPDLLEAGPHGGLLRDLGSHGVDQMIWLLGPVRAVTAHLDWADLPQGRTDVGFVIDLQHENRARSYWSRPS